MTEKKNDEPKAASGKVAGGAEVQAKFDEANAKGYFGHLPEGRPDNEEFTLKGVTSKK